MPVLSPYHDFSNAVKGSFASFARWYRYFYDAVRWFNQRAIFIPEVVLIGINS